MVSASTAYTFWVSKIGKDLTYLVPVLFACGIFLVAAGFIQIFYPPGSLGTAIYNGIGALIFSAWVASDAHKLLNLFSHDEYLQGAYRLFLNTFLLFLNVLN